MTATILSETVLPHLPSASGVEIVGAAAYVVSDDAPLLYVLDAATLAPVRQVQLFASTEFGTGRIPKARKPDLESMAAVPRPGGGAGLLLCGSGSLPTREIGYFVALPPTDATPEASAPDFVQRLDLRSLYNRLREKLPPRHYPQHRSHGHYPHRTVALAALGGRWAGALVWVAAGRYAGLSS